MREKSNDEPTGSQKTAAKEDDATPTKVIWDDAQMMTSYANVINIFNSVRNLPYYSEPIRLGACPARGS